MNKAIKTIKTVILSTVFAVTLSAQSTDLNQRVRNLIDLTQHSNSQIRHYAEYSLEKEFGANLSEVLEAYEQEKMGKSVQKLFGGNTASSQIAEKELAQQGKRAFLRVAEMLSNEKSVIQGLRILEKMGNEAHSFQVEVAKIMSNNETISIRRQGLQTLSAIVAAGQLEDSTIEMIQQAVLDQQMQKDTIRYVGSLGNAGEAFVPQIIQVLETTKNWRLQEEAIKALGKIGTGAVSAVPTLEKMNRFEHKYFSLEDVYINQAITKSLATIRS